eukprot:scaffold119623_cov21-Cyclotella_meneghiniana.AAC.1
MGFGGMSCYLEAACHGQCSKGSDLLRKMARKERKSVEQKYSKVSSTAKNYRVKCQVVYPLPVVPGLPIAAAFKAKTGLSIAI